MFFSFFSYFSGSVSRLVGVTGMPPLGPLEAVDVRLAEVGAACSHVLSTKTYKMTISCFHVRKNHATRKSAAETGKTTKTTKQQRKHTNKREQTNRQHAYCSTLLWPSLALHHPSVEPWACASRALPFLCSWLVAFFFAPSSQTIP